MTWSPLQQQKKLFLLHQVFTSSRMFNSTEYPAHLVVLLHRSNRVPEGDGWTWLPQVVFQVTFTALTESAWATQALMWVGILGTQFTSIYWVAHQNTSLSASQPGEVPMRGLGDEIAPCRGKDIKLGPLSKDRQQWILIDWAEHKRPMQICGRFVALLCLEPIQKTLERTLSHTERVGEETPCT